MSAEHEHHAALKANVTIGILAVILTLTLLFEGGHHWLVHKFHHDRYLIQFVYAFYRVLTLLGLIGLSLFSLIYFGYVKYLNDKLFGRSYVEVVGERELIEEGESPNFAPTEFAEIVEDIQSTVFALMCLYICIGVLMSVWLTWERRKWRQYDLMPYAKFKWLVSSSSSRQITRYWALKQRFLYPKSILAYRTRYAEESVDQPLGEPTFDSRSSHEQDHHQNADHVLVTPQTIFSRYLTECYADLVTKIVRLSPAVWFSALLLLLLGLPFYSDKVLVTYIMTGWSIMILMASCLLLETVVHAADQITPSVTLTREAIAQSSSEAQARIIMPQTVPLESNDFIVAANNRFWLYRWFSELVEGRHIRGSQEHLLPFGSKGRAYLTLLIQVLLFLQVITIAFSLTRLLNPWWTKVLTGETERLVAEGTPGNKATGYVLLAMPGVISLLNVVIVWPHVMKNLMLVTSLERMVCFDKVDYLDGELGTIREKGKRRIVEALKTLGIADREGQQISNKLGSDIFLALPDHIRIQLLTLHKMILNGAFGRGEDVARILNAPHRLYPVFQDAHSLSDREFISRLLHVAYSGSRGIDSESEEGVADAALARSVFDKLDTNLDGYVSVDDVKAGISSTHISPAAIEHWWTSELATSLALHIGKDDFVDYFTNKLRS